MMHHILGIITLLFINPANFERGKFSSYKGYTIYRCFHKSLYPIVIYYSTFSTYLDDKPAPFRVHVNMYCLIIQQTSLLSYFTNVILINLSKRFVHGYYYQTQLG